MLYITEDHPMQGLRRLQQTGGGGARHYNKKVRGRQNTIFPKTFGKLNISSTMSEKVGGQGPPASEALIC